MITTSNKESCPYLKQNMPLQPRSVLTTITTGCNMHNYVDHKITFHLSNGEALALLYHGGGCHYEVQSAIDLILLNPEERWPEDGDSCLPLHEMVRLLRKRLAESGYAGNLVAIKTTLTGYLPEHVLASSSCADRRATTCVNELRLCLTHSQALQIHWALGEMIDGAWFYARSAPTEREVDAAQTALTAGRPVQVRKGANAGAYLKGLGQALDAKLVPPPAAPFGGR